MTKWNVLSFQGRLLGGNDPPAWVGKTLRSDTSVRARASHCNQAPLTSSIGWLKLFEGKLSQGTQADWSAGA
jgi:hypothetical protein